METKRLGETVQWFLSQSKGKRAKETEDLKTHPARSISESKTETQASGLSQVLQKSATSFCVKTQKDISK